MFSLRSPLTLDSGRAGRSQPKSPRPTSAGRLLFILGGSQKWEIVVIVPGMKMGSVTTLMPNTLKKWSQKMAARFGKKIDVLQITFSRQRIHRLIKTDCNTIEQNSGCCCKTIQAGSWVRLFKGTASGLIFKVVSQQNHPYFVQLHIRQHAPRPFWPERPLVQTAPRLQCCLIG